MSKIVELTPDSTLSSTGWAVQFGNGAANPGTLHAALADDLPKTPKVTGIPYTRANDTQAVVAGDLRVTFNSYTLEADERCRRIQLSSIADERACRHRVGMGNGASTVERQGSYEHRSPSSGTKIEQLFGPWVTKAQDGAGLATLEWTQTNINDLRSRITPVASQALGTAYFYRLRARLDIVQQAAPLFITPFENEVFADGTPTLKWITGVPEAQKRFQLRIFTQSVAEDDGFDVNTAANYIYNVSGNTTALTHRVGAGFLENGKFYYAFIKVATDFNGVDWWSNWSPGAIFKINAKPSVTVTAPVDQSTIIDTAKPTVQWVFQDEEGDLQSAYRIIVLQKPVNGWGGNVDPEQESLNGNALYDSQIVTSESTDQQIPVALPNNQRFRAYVLVRQRVPAVLDSDWAFSEFETQYAGPLIPQISAAPATETSVDVTIVPGLANLLTADGSSFEGGISTWVAGTNTTVAQSGTQFLDGTKSLAITKTVGTGTAEALSHGTADVCVPAREGQAFSAMAWIRAGATPRSCHIDIQSLDASNTVIDTQLGANVTDATNGWTKMVVSIPSIVANTVKVRVRVQILSALNTEIHYIDQVMVYQGTGSPAWNLGGGTVGATLGPTDGFSTLTRNLLTPNQSSIETSTTGWIAWTGNTTLAQSALQADDGANSMLMTRITSTGDAQATTPRAPGTIPCNPGDDFTFMASFRAVTTARTVFINFEFFDAADVVIPHVILDQNFNTDSNSAWTRISCRALAPPGAVNMSVNVGAQGCAVGEGHYVDRLALVHGQFDNPATDWSIGDAHTMDVVDARITAGAYLLDWTPPEDVILTHRWDFANNRDCSWILWLLTDGKFKFQWSTDGTESGSKFATSTAANAFVNGSLHYVRVDFDNDNGAAGQDVKFFHGTTLAGATTALGATVTVPTVEPIYSGFAEMVIGGGDGAGGSGWQGYAIEAELRNAMGGGTLEANPIFNIFGIHQFRDIPGRLWVAVNDAEIEYKEKPNPDFFTVERSRDLGVTWEIFRYDDGSVVTNRIPGNLGTFTIRDHEVPLNSEIRYHISAISTGLGVDVNSAFSAYAAVTLEGVLVTLKNTQNPEATSHFPVADAWIEVNHTRNRKVYQPVGRSKPVVIRGSGDSNSFTLNFTTLGAKAAELLALVDADELLFIQTPNSHFWVEVAADVTFRKHLWDALHNEEDVAQFGIPFVEVDRLDENFVASFLTVP